jgi:hypothetical protein
MQNDPELNGKYLGNISADFVKVADLLKEASWQIRKQKISEFPVFIISRPEIHLGKLLISKQEREGLAWNYYASMLEEFVQRQMIEGNSEGEKAFKTAYQNPDEFCCLFVVDENFTKFIFIPYPNEE